MRTNSAFVLVTVLTAALSCKNAERNSVGSPQVDSAVSTIVAGVPTVVLTDTAPRCMDCAVDVRKLMELAEPPGALAFADLPSIKRTASGQFLAYTPQSDFNGVVVYDSSGAFERSMSRKGRGPGELMLAASMVIGLGDTVFVQDAGRRIAVFDPNGAPVREVVTAFGVTGGMAGSHSRFDAMSTGELLLGANVATKDLSGVPLYFTDSRGGLQKAFGTPNLGTMGSATFRVITRAAVDGRFWVVERSNYRLEEVDARSGSILRVVGVHAPWITRPLLMSEVEARAFEKTVPVKYGRVDPRNKPTHLEFAPAPALETMQLDSQNRLWVQWRIAAAGWDTVTLKYPEPEEFRLSKELDDLLYASVVDVIDLTTNTLVMRHRMPFYAQLAGPEFVAHSYYDDVGRPRAEVWRVRPKSPE